MELRNQLQSKKGVLLIIGFIVLVVTIGFYIMEDTEATETEATVYDETLIRDPFRGEGADPIKTAGVKSLRIDYQVTTEQADDEWLLVLSGGFDTGESLQLKTYEGKGNTSGVWEIDSLEDRDLIDYDEGLETYIVRFNSPENPEEKLIAEVTTEAERIN